MAAISSKMKKTVAKQIVKHDVHTQIVEVIRPDGSKETKTVIVDK